MRRHLLPCTCIIIGTWKFLTLHWICLIMYNDNDIILDVRVPQYIIIILIMCTRGGVVVWRFSWEIFAARRCLPSSSPPPPQDAARMDGTRVICTSSVVGKTVGSRRALFITFYAPLRPSSPSAWHLPGHMYLYTRTRLSEAAATATADSYRLPTRVRTPFPSSRPVPTPPPDGDHHGNSGQIKRATDCRPSFSRYRPTAAVIVILDQAQ